MVATAANIGQIGKYQVLARVGGGGMADVYRCRLVGPGGFAKIVALKRIRSGRARDPDFVRMFLDEARLGAGLSHPNVVQIFEIGEADGAPYIAMEYVSGPTLAELLREATRRRQRPLGPLLKIVSDVALGLHHAHTARGPTGAPLGLVHRDVSPQNILVSRDGVAKLFDFGVAKAQGRLVETRVGTLKGKLRYMAPEQLEGFVDARADVFALGICLFEATTGQSPYGAAANDELTLLRRLQKGDLPRPQDVLSDYPSALADIVMHAIAPDPERRCPSALALHERLEEFVAAFAASDSAPAAAKAAATISARALRTWVDELCPAASEDPEGGAHAIAGAARATNGGVDVPPETVCGPTAIEEQTGPSALRKQLRRSTTRAGAWTAALAALGGLGLAMAWNAPGGNTKSTATPPATALLARAATAPLASAAAATQRLAVAAPVAAPLAVAAPARPLVGSGSTPRSFFAGAPTGAQTQDPVSPPQSRPIAVGVRRRGPSRAQPLPNDQRDSTGAAPAAPAVTASRPATAAASLAKVHSTMPHEFVPRPALRKVVEARSREDLQRILADVETETIDKAGCSPEFSRGITAALFGALLGAETTTTIYPAAMYYFIVREAGLGREKAEASRALARVHSSGVVRALTLLPRR